MSAILLMWFWAQDPATPDPTSWVTWLGPFAAAAVIGAWFLRDAIKQRDRAFLVVESRSEVLIEIRDTMRAAVATMQACTVAMQAMVEAQKRCPDAEDVARLHLLMDERERRSR